MLSDTLKSLFKASGKSQVEYANFKGISKSQLGNKIRYNQFSLKDFIDLCNFLELDIKIENNRGKQIATLDITDIEEL